MAFHLLPGLPAAARPTSLVRWCPAAKSRTQFALTPTRIPPPARTPQCPPPTRAASAAKGKASPAAKGKAAPAAKAAAAAKGGKKAPAPKAKGKGKGAAAEEEEEEEEEEDKEEEDEEDEEDEALMEELRKIEEEEDALEEELRAIDPEAAPRAAGKKRAAPASGEDNKARFKLAKLKKPSEMLEEARMAYKWWESEPLPKGTYWRSLEHYGLNFTPAYAPHGLPILYEGKPVTLEPAAEELATMFAGISKDAQQLANPAFAKVFRANFWKDFSRVLGKEHVVKELSKCDFEGIRAHLIRASEAKKAMGKEEKEAIAARKAAVDARTAYALVDGHMEKSGNCTVEPPGLFRGRGEHPKMGALKRRIMPEEITINCAPGVPVPACPMPGHAWKRVVHDPSVSWLAYWTDPVGGHHKYVYLAASSSFKGQADRDKYEKARKLVKCIGVIRDTYEKLLGSADEYERQLGTCMWIIDRLALRVGGDKEEDEADTVGTCSLRPEHVTFPSDTQVELNFLGKDSMRYHNVIDVSRYGDVGLRVLANLKRFCKGKEKDADIFDMVDVRWGPARFFFFFLPPSLSLSHSPTRPHAHTPTRPHAHTTRSPRASMSASASSCLA